MRNKIDLFCFLSCRLIFNLIYINMNTEPDLEDHALSKNNPTEKKNYSSKNKPYPSKNKPEETTEAAKNRKKKQEKSSQEVKPRMTFLPSEVKTDVRKKKLLD
jgi:hypothetical protein